MPRGVCVRENAGRWLCKGEDLGLGLQHPHGRWACQGTLAAPVLGSGQRWADLRETSQAASFRFSEISRLKNRIGQNETGWKGD